MSFAVIRKDQENPDQLLVRFNKITSHFTKDLRKTRYRARSSSRLKRKIGALVREGYRAAREKRKYYV